MDRKKQQDKFAILHDLALKINKVTASRDDKGEGGDFY